eukprot:2458218-Pyramimonas_sp.AAC.1
MGTLRCGYIRVTLRYGYTMGTVRCGYICVALRYGYTPLWLHTCHPPLWVHSTVVTYVSPSAV